MTIKEIAARAGLSHQAIYKRLKARGVSLDEIKDKATGELTPDGAALLLKLFNLQTQQEKEVPPPHDAKPTVSADEVEGLRNQVAELKNEVEKLRNQVATMEDKEKALTEERDFLRLSLERSQQLQAITAAKIPNPPPALPVGEDQKQEGRGLRAWWKRIKDKQHGDQ